MKEIIIPSRLVARETLTKSLVKALRKGGFEDESSFGKDPFVTWLNENTGALAWLGQDHVGYMIREAAKELELEVDENLNYYRQ